MTNVAVVIGRLTANPKTTTIGQKNTFKMSFSIANDTGYGDFKKTHFFDCECIGDRFQGVSQYLVKGGQISVQAEIHQDRWQNNQGQNRSKVKLFVSQINLLSTPQNNQEPKNEGAGITDYYIPF